MTQTLQTLQTENYQQVRSNMQLIQRVQVVRSGPPMEMVQAVGLFLQESLELQPLLQQMILLLPEP